MKPWPIVLAAVLGFFLLAVAIIYTWLRIATTKYQPAEPTTRSKDEKEEILTKDQEAKVKLCEAFEREMNTTKQSEKAQYHYQQQYDLWGCSSLTKK